MIKFNMKNLKSIDFYLEINANEKEEFNCDKWKVKKNCAEKLEMISCCRKI